MKSIVFRKQTSILLVLITALLIFTGCKSSEKTEGVGENGQEEITITIAHPFDEDIFEARYGSIPDLPDNVTLDWVYWDESREGLEELFSQGIEPDIFNSGSVELLKEYDVIIPIDELIEKHNFDTSVIQPSLVAYLKSFDDEQRMIGVPDGGSYFGLFFNKEVFDIFGVPYPDLDKPMTWSEVLELTRQLTAERNGTEYVGLEFHNNDMSAPINQFGLNLTDPKTAEVLVTENPEIQQFFDLIREYNDIPGINSDEIAQSCAFCERKAAMSISWHGLYLWGWDDPSLAEKMDIAPIPVWPELPETAPSLSTYPIMVSSLSEHPDEAFQVLMGYVSEENQLAMSKAVSAGPTTLYPSVQENFAADKETYDGKNVTALFALNPAIGAERKSAKWDGYVDIWGAVNKIATTDIDVPTLLRELKEESEIKITEAKESGE